MASLQLIVKKEGHGLSSLVITAQTAAATTTPLHRRVDLFLSWTRREHSFVWYDVLCVHMLFFVVHASTQQYVQCYPQSCFVKEPSAPQGHELIIHPLPSNLSSIMHSLLSVSKYDDPCNWLTEQMRPWLHYFSLLWDTGTPIFPGATSLSLPLPQRSCLPSAVILFKDCYLYPSNQVSQVKTASHPTREAHNYRGCTAPLLLVYGEKHEAQQTTVPSSLLWLIVIPLCYC